MRWRLISPESLAYRDLDGEIVVRNARTGNTHLLESLSADVWRLLAQRQNLTASELAQELGDNSGEWEATVAAVLEEFQRLGLAQTQTA